jgi:menaquinol-cytochrome c reductase iron-sulfur subunit
MNPDVTRRSFLSGAIAGVAGVIATLLGFPAAHFLMGRAAAASNTDGWVRIAAADSVVPGRPTLVTATVERQQGWVAAQTQVAAYLKTEDGAHFEALSNVCTHLGCRVTLQDGLVGGNPGFFCPCHDGLFDIDGAVVSGPVPAPLERFEVMVEKGDVFVRTI